MTLKSLITLAGVALALSLAPRAGAHCQIPCGIYDDNNVMGKMHTDYETIAKAMKTIPELMENPETNVNQIARWVANKESHAQSIQDIVARYFLAQRLKVDEAASDKESYLRKLSICHKVIVTAMKCKQGVDPAAADQLHDDLHDFAEAFGLHAN